MNSQTKMNLYSKTSAGVPKKLFALLFVFSVQIGLVFAQENTTRVSFGNDSSSTSVAYVAVAPKPSVSPRLIGNDFSNEDGEATTTRRDTSNAPSRVLANSGNSSSQKTQEDGDSAAAVHPEPEDWQLRHDTARPFMKYFTDVRIVGAVRYQADFNLEKSYDILQELTNIQKDLKNYLGISLPEETIEVFFFRSEDSYKRFLAAEFPEAPYDRRALYIKKSGPGMVLVFQGPDMKEDMRHELTHAFLHASIKYVPLWLDEGLAEYFEKPRETRAVENQYFKNIAKKTVSGQPPSLARLEKIKRFDELGAKEYCESWSWIHFMIHRSRDTHELLAGYIQLLKEMGEQTPPIERYLTQMPHDPKAAYLDHFHAWKSRSPDSNEEALDANHLDGNENRNRISRGWIDSLFR